MDNSLVPWVLGELIQDGDQVMGTCSTPVSGHTGSWNGSAGGFETGREEKAFDEFGRYGIKEQGGRIW